MNNLPFTKELRKQARKAAEYYAKRNETIDFAIAIDFWIKNLELRIAQEDVEQAKILFEKTFFLGRIKGNIIQPDKIIQQNYKEVMENFLDLEYLKQQKGQNSQVFDEVFLSNYWLLFFGFFIAASVGYGIYIRNRTFGSKQEETVGSEPANQSCTQLNTISDKSPLSGVQIRQTAKPKAIQYQKFSVVFVVNVSHQNIIDNIKLSGFITPEISDGLCRATKALWAGKSSDFSRTQLNQRWISSQENTSPDIESTFDVHLIWVEFEESELHPGFKENKKLSARLAAFQWLAKIRPRANVSQRLPDSSYTQTEVYRL